MSVKHTPPGKRIVFSTPNWLWGGQREEIIAYCVRPWKIHHSSKARIARLASEYEQIKLALWVWPYGERVCSRSKHHWWVTGRRNKEINLWWWGGGSPPPDKKWRIIECPHLALGGLSIVRLAPGDPEAPRYRGALVTLRNQRVSSRGLWDGGCCWHWVEHIMQSLIFLIISS